MNSIRIAFYRRYSAMKFRALAESVFGVVGKQCKTIRDEALSFAPEGAPEVAAATSGVRVRYEPGALEFLELRVPTGDPFQPLVVRTAYLANADGVFVECEFDHTGASWAFRVPRFVQNMIDLCPYWEAGGERISTKCAPFRGSAAGRDLKALIEDPTRNLSVLVARDGVGPRAAEELLTSCAADFAGLATVALVDRAAARALGTLISPSAQRGEDWVLFPSNAEQGSAAADQRRKGLGGAIVLSDFLGPQPSKRMATGLRWWVYGLLYSMRSAVSPLPPELAAMYEGLADEEQARANGGHSTSRPQARRPHRLRSPRPTSTSENGKVIPFQAVAHGPKPAANDQQEGPVTRAAADNDATTRNVIPFPVSRVRNPNQAEVIQ